jgi:hypothetical protein
MSEKLYAIQLKESSYIITNLNCVNCLKAKIIVKYLLL